MRRIIFAIMIAMAPLSAYATEEQATQHISNGSLSAGSNNGNVIGDNNVGTVNHAGSVGSAGTVVNQASEQVIKNVVPVNPTNLITGGSDVCLGSISGGASAPGISISGGKTTIDENCVMMKQVSLMNALGLTDAAVALMINHSDEMAIAFYRAYPNMVQQFAPDKFAEIEKKLNKAKKKSNNCSFNCN